MLAPPPQPPWPVAPAPVPAPRWPPVLFTLALVAAGLWSVAATMVLHGSAWLVADVLLSLGLAAPALTWPIVAWLNAAAIAVPAGLIGLLARARAPEQTTVRASARAWAAAALAGGLLGSVRAVPTAHHEIMLLLTAVIATTAAVLVRAHVAAHRMVERAGPSATRSTDLARAGLGLAAGLATLLPWALAGALGGPAETVLAGLAAIAVGALAASVLGGGLFPAYAGSRPRLVLLGGLAAGVALTPIGAATGGVGANLAELLVLPALGFAAAALAGSGATLAGSGPAAPRGARAGAPVAILLSLAAFGPLGFVDPEETTLLLGFADVAWWSLVASVASVGIGWAAGAALGLTLTRHRPPRRWAAVTAAGLAALLTAGGFVAAGSPGWHGDRLLVILAEQADLGGLAGIADRTTRVRATHRRLVEHAERTQAPLRQTLRRFGLRHTPYYLVNAVRVEGGAAVRHWLSQRSDVDRVLLDQRLRPIPVRAAPLGGSGPVPDGSPQWNIEMLGADRVWRDFGTSGEGIVIGTSDSGVDGAHPALRASFRGGDDSWYDPWNATTSPVDHNGHGTHTLGSALGSEGIGVAPGARWIGCANLDRNLGSPSLYLECMQFMLAPFPLGGDPARDARPERAPHIMTNSWGCPPIEGCDLDSLRPATAALRAAGIFFVTAAGNTGPICSSVDDPPAPYPDVVTVGAVDRERAVTDFSSRGPTPDQAAKPDLMAPGADVLSALPAAAYGALGGTSMATPHVAGTVALMWSANPRLIGDVDTTTRILRQSAAPVSQPPSVTTGTLEQCGGEANVTGAGLVDAYAAVSAARAA